MGNLTFRHTFVDLRLSWFTAHFFSQAPIAAIVKCFAKQKMLGGDPNHCLFLALIIAEKSYS